MNQNHHDIDENLLLQYLLGNPDESIRNTVGKWLEADSRNRQHLDRLEALWMETGKLDPPPLPVDLTDAWARLSNRIEKHEAHQTTRRKQPAGIRYLKYALSAAALILLMFGAIAVFKYLTSNVIDIEVVTTASVLHDTLPDGSRFMLNEKSKLTYSNRFQGEKRSVQLAGEAFFEVAGDPAKPFVVDAGKAQVQVLGTMFNVSAYPGEDIQVTVTEGRVMFFTINAVNHDTLSVILEAGMTGVLGSGAPKPVIVEDPAPDRLFWAHQLLDFRGTPLSEAFGMIEKYYGVKVSVSTPEIYDCRLSASFMDDPANRIMTVIAESFGLELTVDGNNYHLSGNGCSKEIN
jgi:ferric-dicitrate binding protein FerR (iron transport regulator)